MIAVVQAVTMQRVQDGMRITTKPQHSATIFLSNSSNNTAKYANPEYDKAIAESYVATDAEGRAKAYAKAEEILAKDFGIVPILTM